MIDVTNPHRMHPTSILDVYQVFEKLHMLWMGIWVHPYSITPVQASITIWTIGVRQSPNDIVVS